MYFSQRLSTLSLLEQHIKSLEFAFYQVSLTIDFGLKQQLEIELGHAYNSKMSIIKNSNINNTKVCQSKINNDAVDSKDKALT